MLKSKSTTDIRTQTDSSYRQYGNICTIWNYLQSSQQLNALLLFSLVTSEIFQLTHRYRYQFVEEFMTGM